MKNTFFNILLCEILCAVGCLGQTSNPQTQAATNSPADNFKSFLQSRPVVEEIIYGRRSVATKGLLASLKPPQAADTNNQTFYMGRWQPGAFLEQFGAGSLEAYKEGRLAGGFHGKFNGHYWQMNFPIVTIYKSETPDAQAIQMMTVGFEQLLNFGLPNVMENSLNWDGDRFRATSINGKAMTGRLKVNNEQEPEQLYCKINGYDWDYLFSYEYAHPNTAGEVFPSKILSSVLKGGITNPIAEITIFSLKTGVSPLASNLIDPEYLIPMGTRKLAIVSNGMTYLQQSDGKLFNLTTAPRLPTPGGRAGGVRLLVFGLFMLAAGLPILVLVRKTQHPK